MKIDFHHPTVSALASGPLSPLIQVNRVSSDPVKVFPDDLTAALPKLADEIKDTISLCGDRTLVDLTLQWDTTIDGKSGRILATLYSIETP